MNQFALPHREDVVITLTAYHRGCCCRCLQESPDGMDPRMVVQVQLIGRVKLLCFDHLRQLIAKELRARRAS